ncbi:MAG: hypothetical protein IPG97_14950 [Microthrixaceae bacterium]|nr:hypothetical protein [Microthrixaceae bacterium]
MNAAVARGSYPVRVLCAVVANSGRARHHAPRLPLAIATIAAMFAGLYIGDLTGLLATGTRGDLAAGVAPVAWLVAWTAAGSSLPSTGGTRRGRLDGIDRLSQIAPCAGQT